MSTRRTNTANRASTASATENPESRLLLVIGLARRAGQLLTGTDLVCESLRDVKKRPGLVIEAGDTSDNTHKKLTDKCATYAVSLIRLGTDGATLARAVGKTGSLAAVSVRGELCRAVLSAWEATHTAGQPGTDDPSPEKNQSPEG